MNATGPYRDPWISPRLKLSALWVATLLVYVYVDLFSLLRSDVRADLDVGRMGGFTVSQSFLMAITAYVIVPSLMVFLTLVLPVRVARVSNIVLAGLYLLTVVASAFDNWVYFVFGSVVEIILLAGIVYIAWTWPREAAGEG